jgi:soluble lytic murein transglycosylase
LASRPLFSLRPALLAACVLPVLASGAALAQSAGTAAGSAPAPVQPWLDVLTPADEAAYRAAFAAIAATDTAGLAQALARVDNGVLKPVVEQERLTSPAMGAGLAELAGFLERQGTLAGAGEVMERAVALKAGADPASPEARLALDPPDPIPQRRAMGSVREPSFNPAPQGPGTTPAQRTAVDTAARRFYAGDDSGALELALPQVSGPLSGQAGWISGLAAWRQGDFATAHTSFTATANWASGDDWSRAGGAFWAARAAERLGETQRRDALLEQAASYPLTFYGQLALERLGRWTSTAIPTLDDQTRRARTLAASNPGVRRAIALTEIGRRGDAEGELLAAWARGRAEDDLGFLQLATDLALGDVAQRIATVSPAASIAARYPVPSGLAPQGGSFVLDRAVVLAVIRQESRFDPQAVSSAGARGLMQVMPATAAWMTGRPELRANPRLLHNTALNLSLGEAYLERMMAQGPVGADLIRTFMAYNAGPGNLSAWAASVRGGSDPLLFLEAAPVGQSRIYAEKVMANMWIYARRLGQPAPSLERLARGMAPLYEPQDNPRSTGWGTAARTAVR